MASHLQTRHSQCEPMLAVLDCLRRLQANLTELTWATQQCISAEWLAMTGYWLLHGAINALITTFLAMHCEVFCGLGQVAVIDRRQCIQHNGLLIDIAQLAAASMISGLPSYGIIIKPFRSFSTFNLRKMCQIVSVKSSFKVGDLRSAKDPHRSMSLFRRREVSAAAMVQPA